MQNEKRIPQSVGQIAKQMEISRQTLRNWISEFGEFLSPGARRKTRKKFTENDVLMLGAIRRFLQEENLTYTQARQAMRDYTPEPEILEPEYTPNPDPDPDPGQAGQALQTLDLFANMLEGLQTEHDQTIAAKDDHIRTLKNELAWRRLPWYKKLFRDPPGG